MTVGSFLCMALGAYGATYALSHKDFTWFMVSFLWLFVFTGVGNGSIYRMIPEVFHAIMDDSREGQARARRLAAGAIGIVGAAGAYGGFLVPQGFAISKANSIDAAHKHGTIVPALWVIIALYLVMAITTWAVYGRKGAQAQTAQHLRATHGRHPLPLLRTPVCDDPDTLRRWRPGRPTRLPDQPGRPVPQGLDVDSGAAHAGPHHHAAGARCDR